MTDVHLVLIAKTETPEAAAEVFRRFRAVARSHGLDLPESPVEPDMRPVGFRTAVSCQIDGPPTQVVCRVVSVVWAVGYQAAVEGPYLSADGTWEVDVTDSGFQADQLWTDLTFVSVNICGQRPITQPTPAQMPHQSEGEQSGLPDRAAPVPEMPAEESPQLVLQIAVNSSTAQKARLSGRRLAERLRRGQIEIAFGKPIRGTPPRTYRLEAVSASPWLSLPEAIWGVLRLVGPVLSTVTLTCPVETSARLVEVQGEALRLDRSFQQLTGLSFCLSVPKPTASDVCAG